MLLLNRVLTVRPGAPGSHRGKGWEEVTECAIEALVARGGPLVAILWGRDAQSLAPRLAGVPQIASAHPSPMSAHAGLLRVAAVQPGQRSARGAGRHRRRLAART